MLNKTQVLQALLQRIQAAGKPLACELCGSQTFTVGDFHSMPVTPEPTPGVFISGTVMPLEGLVCEGCGNTKFINLVMLEKSIMQRPPMLPDRVDRIIGQALSQEPPSPSGA